MSVESKIEAKIIADLAAHNSLNNQELFQCGLLVPLLQGDENLGGCPGFRHSVRYPDAASLEEHPQL
jgi:hypothetical protein